MHLLHCSLLSIHKDKKYTGDRKKTAGHKKKRKKTVAGSGQIRERNKYLLFLGLLLKIRHSVMSFLLASISPPSSLPGEKLNTAILHCPVKFYLLVFWVEVGSAAGERNEMTIR